MDQTLFFSSCRRLKKDTKITTIKREIYKAPEHSSLILNPMPSQQYIHFAVRQNNLINADSRIEKATLTSDKKKQKIPNLT